MRSFSVFAVLGMFVVACPSGSESDEGGAPGSGGVQGSGGKAGTGGSTGSGGKTATGGTGSGGKTGSGGTGSGGKGTGGTTQPGSIDCTDESTDKFEMPGQYDSREVSTGSPKKTYYFMANWWGSPYSGQSESINGLSFTIKSPSSTASSNNNPLGFPTLFIGDYGTRGTQGSGLPKQVSALTSVPTIFSTNADSKGNSNYNAAYDVWFTKSSGGVTGSSPGQGGAYLMVWLFAPSDRRPRGSIVAQGALVSGVKGAWDVWYDSATDPPCVSYVSITDLASLEFDLNYFIQHAVQGKYGVTKDQYLSIVFAGFEVWGGGDGLQVKKFCANVK